MKTFFRRLNPRRRWLWRTRRVDIEAAGRDRQPRPHDLGQILIKARTGETFGSPQTGRIRGPAPKTIGANERRISPSQYERVISGGEAFALYGAGIAEKFHTIDDHVYQTMSHLSQTQITNLADLSARFTSHWDHSAWTGLTPSAIDKLSGHLGETYAAEHLQHAGAAVEWPSASNQPGYDLLISGHAVNVKTIADASELHQHFSQYPNIAALVPSDTHNIPSGAFDFSPGDGTAALDNYLDLHHHHAVIVDHALSHTEVLAHAANSSEAALGGASIVDFHLPWLTIARSGWREVKLLKDAQTDLTSAIKNLGIDVAGKGGAAFAGAKTGALVGTFFGPMGSAAGAVVGALGGGIGGLKVADSIKRRPMLRAIILCKEAELQLQLVSVKQRDKANARYQNARRAEQASLKNLASIERQSVRVEYDRTVLVRNSLERAPEDSARGLLRMLAVSLARNRRALVVEHERVGFIGRWIWPTIESMSIELALAELSVGIALTENMDHRAEQLNHAELFGLLARFGIAESIVREINTGHARTCEELERSLLEKIREAQMRLAKARVSAFQRLAKAVGAIAESMQNEMRQPLNHFATASKLVQKERAKLGLTG